MSSTMLLLLGGGLVFAALTLVLSLVGVVTSERQGVARSLAAVVRLMARGPSTPR